MANPYTSVSVSGYNSGAPPDDGTTGSDNTLTWAKHKTKIGDPLKTAIEAVNTNALAAFGKLLGNAVSAQAAGFAIGASDQGKIFTVSAAATVTLLAAATASTNFTVAVYNSGTVTVVTIDPNSTETINGQTTFIVAPGSAVILVSDGSNWTGLFMRPGPRLMTEQATTSGTSKDFTSIPSWVHKITVMFDGVSTSGTDAILIQIGDTSGVEVANYLAACTQLTDGVAVTVTAYTTGFGINMVAAGAVIQGAVTLTLMDRTNQTWTVSGGVGHSNAARVTQCHGAQTLTGGFVLDRVRITTTGGTDTFDAGSVNLLIE